MKVHILFAFVSIGLLLQVETTNANFNSLEILSAASNVYDSAKGIVDDYMRANPKLEEYLKLFSKSEYTEMGNQLGQLFTFISKLADDPQWPQSLDSLVGSLVSLKNLATISNVKFEQLGSLVGEFKSVKKSAIGMWSGRTKLVNSAFDALFASNVYLVVQKALNTYRIFEEIQSSQLSREDADLLERLETKKEEVRKALEELDSSVEKNEKEKTEELTSALETLDNESQRMIVEFRARLNEKLESLKSAQNDAYHDIKENGFLFVTNGLAMFSFESALNPLKRAYGWATTVAYGGLTLADTVAFSKADEKMQQLEEHGRKLAHLKRDLDELREQIEWD